MRKNGPPYPSANYLHPLSTVPILTSPLTTGGHMPQPRQVRSFSTSAAMMKQIEETAARQGISQSALINKALEKFFATNIARSAWETVSEDAWYNPKEFYTYSSDKQGHSTVIKLAVPKHVAGMVAEVVGSGVVPEYRTNQDLFRDAILHRAYQIGKWLGDEELIRQVTLAILESEEAKIAQERQDAEALMEITAANLKSALERGDTEWMKHHIKGRLEKSSSIPELYREEYVEMLKKFEVLAKQPRAKGKFKILDGGAAEG